MTFSLNAPLQEKPLPLLRGDIKIYRGPDEVDGSPTYNCLDPVKAQYYKISWMEMAIIELLRPGMTLAQLTNELNQKSTLKVTPEEVQSFFEEAGKNGLLSLPRSSDDIAKEALQKQQHPILWVLYHYLYIRIPILNPDAFLTRTLHYVRPLVSTPAILTYIILTLVGLSQLIDRFGEFLTTFPYFFNFQGFLFYASTISIVKVIHEFSHAYVAKYYRLHIPTMGVAFIVLWPVLYTDVTDGWKLNKRSQRLAISAAGVAAESVLAGISTLGWALTQPGFLHSAFFVVASATWISTLAVNLNPAMRFDGYYLMSDLMGIDNLQARAFAYTRWQLRKWFLGINVPAPEEGVTPQRKTFMLAYSIYTWIYRLTLYTVIAIFVYYEFTKALGILLFLVEIAFFILPPFVSEAKQLYKLKPFMHWNIRSILTTIVFGGLLFWLIVPLPHLERFPAVSIPAVNQIIYVPFESRIESIDFKLGDVVEPNKVLAILRSRPLQIEIGGTQADREKIKAEAHVLSLKEEDRAFLPEKGAELAAVESKLRTLLLKHKVLTLKSLISGTVYEWDDTIKPGRHVEKNQIIAKIAPLNHVQVMAFVPENRIPDVEVGKSVGFRLHNNLEKFTGTIIDVSPVRENFLLYPALASIYKGDLPVIKDQHQRLQIIETYYAVRIELDSQKEGLQIGVRGHICTRGIWRSKIVEFIRYLWGLYLRESAL